MTRDLTKRQKEVFNFIKSFIENQGTAPRYEDLKTALNVSSNQAIFHHLQTLEKKGYIERSRSPRSIRITAKNGKVNNFQDIFKQISQLDNLSRKKELKTKHDHLDASIEDYRRPLKIISWSSDNV